MKLLPFDQDRFNANMAAAVRQLQRKAAQAERPATEEIAPFSAAGALAVTTSGEAPGWRVRTGGQIVSASAHLNTAGTSDTVVTFYLNGVSIGTVTLASSATDAIAYLGNYRAKNGDIVRARITTAGTGARGLSAFLVMKG